MKVYSQLVSAQAENKASDYSSGTKGRYWFNTSTSLLKYDSGSAVKTVVSTDDTQTLTNKTLTGNKADTFLSNSGTATITLPTTTSTLSTLALAETLTNKTIAGLAFTTFAKGDVLYASAADTLNRLAIGSNGQVLKVATDVPAWQSAANSSTTVSKTANYTLTSNDDVVFANADGASSFTLTLPAAASNSGKVYRIKKTGSDISKTITIDGNLSETVDGAATYILYTLGEEVEIVCDGSNWILLNHRTSTDWTSYSITPQGASSNPTVGTTTTNAAYWKREGTDCLIRYDLVQTVAGSAGSGAYYFNIPSNLTADSIVLTSTTLNRGHVGTGFISTNNNASSAAASEAIVSMYTNQYFSIWSAGISANQLYNTLNTMGSFIFDFSNSALIISVTLRVPISGWKA